MAGFFMENAFKAAAEPTGRVPDFAAKLKTCSFLTTQGMMRTRSATPPECRYFYNRRRLQITVGIDDTRTVPQHGINTTAPAQESLPFAIGFSTN
jgi:hypothetical protein